MKHISSTPTGVNPAASDGERHAQIDDLMRMTDVQFNELKGMIDVNTQMNKDVECQIYEMSNIIKGIWERLNELEDAIYNTLPEHKICCDVKISQLLNTTDEFISCPINS